MQLYRSVVLAVAISAGAFAFWYALKIPPMSLSWVFPTCIAAIGGALAFCFVALVGLLLGLLVRRVCRRS